MQKNPNKEPLVSVIMNCFNGESFLKESIESAINQTYQNWELIFWDNRSTDKSAEIFKKHNDKRLQYYYANEHTTLTKGRNLAIEKTKGEFIAFLDTDDLWHIDKLKVQMHYFRNPEVGLVFSNYWILKKSKNKKKIYSKKILPRGSIYYELIKNYNIGTVTAIIKKNYYLKLKKKFDERFSIIGDFDLFSRLSKECISESVQNPLAYCRLHGNNLTNLKKEKEFEEFEIWLKENKDHLSKLNIKNFQKRIDYIKFVNYKIEGKYKKCINVLFKSEISLFNIKNLFIFFTPTILLKKFLWYYQDSK